MGVYAIPASLKMNPWENLKGMVEATDSKDTKAKPATGCLAVHQRKVTSRPPPPPSAIKRKRKEKKYSPTMEPPINHRNPWVYEFCSISLNSFLICTCFSIACSLLCLARVILSARRHSVTSRLTSLQPPVARTRKPRAWHSSRAVMISSQAFLFFNF